MTVRSRPELTLRGRCFVAAGVTVAACSVLLGQAELLRVGVLTALLPGLAWLLVSLRRVDVEVARLVPQPVLPAGTPLRIELVITGGARLATLTVEEQLPYALGSRPRFALRPTTDRSEQQRVHYTVRSDVRGRFTLGPLTTRVADPFGLVEVRRTCPGTAVVTVTPRVTALPRNGLSGGRAGAGDRQLPVAVAGSAEDVTVREYHRGDDLRRVHWRSSAHVGELMVRREEQPSEARATVLLDNRGTAHAGTGPAGSLEAAVGIAASVAAHLDGHGYAVRLATADGATQGPEPLATLLERLAVVGPSERSTLDVAWSDRVGRGLVVVVLGEGGAADTPALRRLRDESARAAALVLDVGTWRRDDATHAAMPSALPGLGWHAVLVGRHESPVTAWRELAPRRARR